jgi:RNA polymerase sigma factor (sigma-70 family)
MAVTDGTDSSLAAETDVRLLALVRAGQDAAFGELFARHAAAVRGYALRCCTDVAEAEDMAAEAFFRVLQAVRRGSGPEDNVRGYLLTVVRRLAAEWGVRRRDVPVDADELSRQVDAGASAPASRADLQLIARAFTSLPRRWRAVLWRVEVEGERPAVVARHFGLSANATAALARRARQGLRAAYLQAHLAPAGSAACRSVVDKLGAFTAGQVTGAESARIRDHLAGCLSCQALHAELVDVCAGLRRYAGGPAAAVGVHHALGGHHALLGKVGLATGRVAVAGARLKLVAAAVSMAAVGGFGVAAGPIIDRLGPSPHADRGIAVGPALLSSERSTGPTPSSTGSFDPRMRADLRGPTPGTGALTTPDPGHGSTTGAVDTGPTTNAEGDPSTGRAGTSTTPSDSVTGTSGPSAEMTMELQKAGAQPSATGPTTTSDPVGLTTTPTGRPTAGITGTPTDGGTTWTTSWTSDGTTVWEWSWTRGPG